MDEFERGIDSAKKKFKSFSDNIKSLSDGISKSYSGLKDVLSPAVDGFKAVEGVGKKAGSAITTGLKGFATAATAVGTFGTAAVKSGMSFDSTMSQVSAISGATGQDFDALRDKAIEMGAKTQFSASEAAAAMTYMGMAGWKTEDMLGGIAGIMDLAAASGEDLAATSDIVTDALTAFGMKASESGRLADVMAVAATNANTDVGMMGETFKYVAPVAGSLGYSVEDSALAIGLMANSSIKASQAGTSLRSIITRLATNAGASSKSMGALDVLTQALGVSFYDTEGNARDLNSVLMEAREAWRGLGDEEATYYAKKIAGQEAISGWLAIMNASTEDVNKLTNALENANGAASKMAAIRLDNLAGDLTYVKSNFESLQIAISDSLTPTLREFAQFGKKAMENLLEGLQGSGVHGFMNVLQGIVSDAVNMLSSKATEFTKVSLDFVLALANGILASRDHIVNAAKEMIDIMINGIDNWLNTSAGSLIEFGTNMVDTIFSGFQNAGELISKHIGEFVPLIANAFLSYHESLFVVGIDILGAIGKGIIENKGEIQRIASETIAHMVSSLRENAPAIIEGGLALLEALVGAIVENLPLILVTGAEIVGELIAGIATASPGVKAIIATAVIPHILKIVDTIGSVGKAVTAIVPLVSSGISTIMGIGSKLMGGVQALWGLIVAHPVVAVITAIIAAVVLLWNNCEAFRNAVGAIWEAITGFFVSAWDTIRAAWEGVGEFFRGIWEGISSAFEGVIDFFAGIFEGAATAVKAAWEAVTSFFSGIWEGIKNIFSSVADVLGGFFSAAASAVQSAWDAVVSFFSGVWESIQGVFSNVASVLGGFFSDAWSAIESVWGAVSEFFSGIAEGIHSAFENVTSFLSSAFETAWSAVQSAWDAAVSFFQGVWDGISGAFSAAADWFGGIFSQARSAVENAWEGITGFFSGIWESITGVFSDAWDRFKEIGGNIVNGIKDGIAAVWEALTGWFKDKLNSLVGGVKNLLGIHSPSTVFAEIGNYMAAGLGNGWDSGIDTVKRKIASDLSGIQSEINRVLSMSGYDANVDYAKLMLQAKDNNEFEALAAKRSEKMKGEGINSRSNTSLKNEWFKNQDKEVQNSTSWFDAAKSALKKVKFGLGWDVAAYETVNALGLKASEFTVDDALNEVVATFAKYRQNDLGSSIQKTIEALDYGFGFTTAEAKEAVNAMSKAISATQNSGGMTVNIYSPEKVDAVQAAREWEKTSQRIAMGLV